MSGTVASYKLDYNVSDIKLSDRKTEDIPEEELRDLILLGCPFSLTPITDFIKTKDGYEILLFRSDDILYTSEPSNVVKIKLKRN